MSVATGIPTNIRVPGIYIALDPSRAGSVSDKPTTVILGQRLATGTVNAGVLTRVTSAADVGTKFGHGSMIHRVAVGYFANDTEAEVWCLAQDDAEGATSASDTYTVAGPATASGTIHLYVEDTYIPIGVTSGDAATTIAGNIRAALQAVHTDRPWACTGTGAQFVITARNGGTYGNIKVHQNHRGATAGEVSPAGVAITNAAGTNITTQVNLLAGATDATLVLTALGDIEFDTIVNPYTVDAQCDVLDAELARRWGYAVRLYSLAFGAKSDSSTNLDTWGATRNSGFASTLGYEAANQAWAPQVAGAYAGAMSASLRLDPAAPAKGIILHGIGYTPESGQFTMTERNTILWGGVASCYHSGGYMRIERSVANYQTNAAGVADAAFSDIQTAATLRYINRAIAERFATKYSSHKLADDGARLPPGQKIMTPLTAKTELIGLYEDWQDIGIVENAEAFATALTVERNALDRTRLDALIAPDLINQFYVFAMANQFIV